MTNTSDTLIQEIEKLAVPHKPYDSYCSGRNSAVNAAIELVKKHASSEIPSGTLNPITPRDDRKDGYVKHPQQIESDRALNLKPCPGCGNTDIQSYEESDYHGQVFCHNCGWNVQQKSKDEAEYLWNIRYEPCEIRLPSEPERSVLEHLYAYVSKKDLQDGKYVERALYRLIQQSTEREIGKHFLCAARHSDTGPNDPQDCGWPNCGCDQYADKVIAALQESGAFDCKKCDAEMLRVKMCEHIAEGEEGWNKPENRNICPSTMAVAQLRDHFESAVASLEKFHSQPSMPSDLLHRLKNVLFNVNRGLSDHSALAGVQLYLQDLIKEIEDW